MNIEDLEYGEIKNELDAMLIGEEPPAEPFEKEEKNSLQNGANSISDVDGDYIFKTAKV